MKATVTFRITDDAKGEIYEDEARFDIRHLSEITTVVDAWCHGRERDPAISECRVKNIAFSHFD